MVYQKWNFLTLSCKYITVMWLQDEWVRLASWSDTKISLHFVVGQFSLGSACVVSLLGPAVEKAISYWAKRSGRGDEGKKRSHLNETPLLGFWFWLFFPPFLPCSATRSFLPAVLIYSRTGQLRMSSLPAPCCIPAPLLPAVLSRVADDSEQSH